MPKKSTRNIKSTHNCRTSEIDHNNQYHNNHPNNQSRQHLNQEKMNHAINVVNSSLKITLTCVKPKTSRAKIARSSDISLHYTKH